MTNESYLRYYWSYLNRARSAGAKVIEQHPFLTTPFYLDAVRRNHVELDGTRLSRLDIIALDAQSERPGDNVVHPHALAETGSELLYFVECLTASPAAAMQDQRFRELLTREWTSSWFELLTEHMRLNQNIADALGKLKRYLDERLAGNAKTRWKLAATFAMSNLITALVEAKQLLNFNSSIQFCNLQRTTFQDVVFDGGRLQAVDCTGAIFDGAQFKSGEFVAVDCTEATFNNCKFDGGNFHSICCKQAKFGGAKLGESATFANSDFTNAVWPEVALKGQFAAKSVNCLGLTDISYEPAPTASLLPPPIPPPPPLPPVPPNSSGGS
ncbi:MAG TPA: pentapeptide repeat-containing protein [Pirellulaceae bacterium]|nr:pentapeptide repeat-containing protein [Pirellulaceae bacterium]